MPLHWVKEKIWPKPANTSPNFDRYVSSTPSLQNAIDAVAGWNTSAWACSIQGGGPPADRRMLHSGVHSPLFKENQWRSRCAHRLHHVHR
jgi:hypothetical protein